MPSKYIDAFEFSRVVYTDENKILSDDLPGKIPEPLASLLLVCLEPMDSLELRLCCEAVTKICAADWITPESLEPELSCTNGYLIMTDRKDKRVKAWLNREQLAAAFDRYFDRIQGER